MRATTATVGRRTGFLAAALLLTCSLCAAAAASAGAGGSSGSLDARYFQRNWRRGDGPPGNSVYAIAQAADGYLWIGTENGLPRFDGRRFVAVGARSPGVFRSRLVGALAAGCDGTLWIGTERGLLRMRGGAVAPEGPPGGLAADAAVTALAEDSGGDLWIGTRELRHDQRRSHEPGAGRRHGPADLIAAADEALYRAKQSGRNQVLVSDRAARQPAVAAGEGKRRLAAA